GEHADRLDDDQPQRLGAELVQRRRVGEAGRAQGVCRRDDHAVPPPTLMPTTAPAVTPRLRCTPDPVALAGSHTTRAAMSTTDSGSTISPRSVDTVTGSPGAAPISAAVAADSSARAGFAVPARYGSPSCRVPASMSCRQVASTACPRAAVAG